MSEPTTAVTLVGAGSMEFTQKLLADLVSVSELGAVDLRLHDIDSERLSTAESLAHHLLRRSSIGSRVRVTASLNRLRSLDGADFVVNTIQVGGLASTRADFAVPGRYGLRQTIADTLGIGGIFRALRTAPVLAGIASDMTHVCPDAWLLNYTNPMAMNVGYIHEVAPHIKVVGLCHSVYWTVAGLCELLEVPLEEVTYLSAGVNHQAWLLAWERDGQTLYPSLDARIASDPDLCRRVRVDMYQRLGFYPTETSEHSAEYVPWYLHHESEVARLRIQADTYIETSEANVRAHAELSKTLASGDSPYREEGGVEYAPQVIESIVTGRKRRIVGTVANNGFVANLPAGAPVEVPCDVDSNGIHPVTVGDLPIQCAALNRAYLQVVELTIRAAALGDPYAIRHAAMLDPHTAAALTLPDIWAMCDELVRAHGALLAEPLRRPLGSSGAELHSRSKRRAFPM